MGSEMCIRDSCRSAPSGRRRRCCSGTTPTATACWTRASPPPGGGGDGRRALRRGGLLAAASLIERPSCCCLRVFSTFFATMAVPESLTPSANISGPVYLAILPHCSSARQPRSAEIRGPEKGFGDTEERLSQFGDKWQILNAIREHYLMKREADHGSQLFWDRIFSN